MKKLTNESKARFFAQYFNQEVYKDIRYPQDHKKYNLGGYVLNKVHNGCNDFVLELTPLQNISDEHAIEVAKLVKHIGCSDNSTINNGALILDCISGKRTFIMDDLFLSAQESILAYQYLQSKGYALDWFCPIENRIIPVQEQIDNGWITLKTDIL